MTTEATTRAVLWLANFENALADGNTAAATAMFLPDGYWRDLVAFTWNFKTSEGAGEIRAMLDAVLARVKPGTFRIQGEASEAEDEDGEHLPEEGDDTFCVECGAECGPDEGVVQCGTCECCITCCQCDVGECDCPTDAEDEAREALREGRAARSAP